MADGPDLLVGIPTIHRPDAVLRTLNAVNERVGVPCDVVVVDATPSEDFQRDVYDGLGEYWPELRVVHDPSLEGPAASQRRLAEKAVAFEADYLHVLHDDITPREQAVARLYGRVSDGPVDIAGGVCHEPDGSARPLGRDYHEVESEGRRRVMKTPFQKTNALGPTRFDHVEPMVVIDVDVFGEPGADAPGVMYDPEYEFLLEQWDFYMQARAAGLRVEAVPHAHFDHHDDAFDGVTARDRQDLLADKTYFAEKWGVWPGRE